MNPITNNRLRIKKSPIRDMIGINLEYFTGYVLQVAAKVS
jgi:hypothetical protein